MGYFFLLLVKNAVDLAGFVARWATVPSPCLSQFNWVQLKRQLNRCGAGHEGGFVQNWGGAGAGAAMHRKYQ